MTETTLDELTTVEEPRDFTGDDEDDDDDGPPPGFNCISRPTAADSEENIVYEEEDEDEEEETQGDEEEDMDRAPPGWSSLPATLQPPDKEMRIHQKGAQSGPKTPTSSQLLPHVRSQPQAPASLPSDKGQVVCGTCLQLLAYPRGVKYVKCSCCQTINLVLEADQVGQVKCGGCAALLMYPHGAPSVKCCSCRFVTDIGAHNRQPPLSTQLARRRSSLNSVR